MNRRILDWLWIVTFVDLKWWLAGKRYYLSLYESDRTEVTAWMACHEGPVPPKFAGYTAHSTRRIAGGPLFAEHILHGFLPRPLVGLPGPKGSKR